MARIVACTIFGAICLCAAFLAIPERGSGQPNVMPSGPRPDGLVAAVNSYGALNLKRAPIFETAPSLPLIEEPDQAEQPEKTGGPVVNEEREPAKPTPVKAVAPARKAGRQGPPLAHGHWIYHTREGHLYWRWHR